MAAAPLAQVPKPHAFLHRPAAEGVPAFLQRPTNSEPTSRPTARGVPALRGNAGAQALDEGITQCGHALERNGVPGFWVPARRDLVMELPVGSGAAVLDAFVKLVPQLVTFEAESEEKQNIWLACSIIWSNSSGK
jgi:hypothetical protein